MDIDNRIAQLKNETYLIDKEYGPYQQLRLEVEREEYKRCYRSVLRHQLQKGDCKNEILQTMYDREQDIRSMKDIKHIWLTVSPEESKTIQDLHLGIENLKYKKYPQTMTWVFEQRGETEETAGVGIHFHMLLELNTDSRYDSIKRSIHTIFDKLCGNPLCVCIKPCYERWVQDKHDYLDGKKWDEEKDDKIMIDKLWRRKIGIQEKYTWVRN